jgi:hypothetical protein
MLLRCKEYTVGPSTVGPRSNESPLGGSRLFFCTCHGSNESNILHVERYLSINFVLALIRKKRCQDGASKRHVNLMRFGLKICRLKMVDGFDDLD